MARKRNPLSSSVFKSHARLFSTFPALYLFGSMFWALVRRLRSLSSSIFDICFFLNEIEFDVTLSCYARNVVEFQRNFMGLLVVIPICMFRFSCGQEFSHDISIFLMAAPWKS